MYYFPTKNSIVDCRRGAPAPSAPAAPRSHVRCTLPNPSLLHSYMRASLRISRSFYLTFPPSVTNFPSGSSFHYCGRRRMEEDFERLSGRIGMQAPNPQSLLFFLAFPPPQRLGWDHDFFFSSKKNLVAVLFCFTVFLGGGKGGGELNASFFFLSPRRLGSKGGFGDQKAHMYVRLVNM